MIEFRYDEDAKEIICKHDYEYIYLYGGKRMRDQKDHYPLTPDNINAMFKHHPEDKNCHWFPSLKVEIVDAIRKNISFKSSKHLLTKLTIDNIKNYPMLIKSNGIEPFKNQHISQYYGRYCEEHAALWEMGTGKTRAAIDVYQIKKKQGLVTNGFVVCPLSMVNKWVDQIEEWTGIKNSACAVVGSREDKLEILSLGFEWYVTTYETYVRWQDEFKFVNEKWFVVLDETTKIKNPNTKRAKACFALGLKTVHKMILTGTPVTQNAYDVWSQFRFLDNGKTFGFNYDMFINEYFWKQGFKLIAKNNAPEKISTLMYGKATRFLKTDCIDIPPKLYDQRLLDLPPENKKKYDEMVMYALTQINGSGMVTAPVILTQLLRLSQITSGFVKDVVGKEIAFEENPKINALEEILEEVEGKVVIWSRFQWDIENIMKLCDKMQIKAVTLYGKDSANVRTDNIRQFQTGDAKVIVGTASTGGHGIDLVAAKTVIYYSNSYSLEQRLQSEDRAHRAGQVNQVQYIDLLCKKTIDVSIYKILRQKKNIADLVTRDNIRGLLT